MNQTKPRFRLDKILLEKGLVESRSRAQILIREGKVRVDGQMIMKPGAEVDPEAEISLSDVKSDYVSRSAHKLIAALDHFDIGVLGRSAIDVGASTGGFTEVLLERGSERVHALDVGSGQLVEKLRCDPRVKGVEYYNARNLRPDDFEDLFDLLVMDVSFISIRLILPAAVTCLREGSDLIVLFKPQFEVGREHIGKGGIVTDQEIAESLLQETLQWAEGLDLRSQGWIPSPIKGGDGNQEYLIYWKHLKKGQPSQK